MARVFTEDFEGGTDGAPVTTSNTTFASIEGTPTFTATDPAWGTLACDCNATGSSTRVMVSPSVSTPYFRRWYIKMPTLPASNFYVASLTSGGSSRADMRINTNGAVAVRNGFSAQWTSTATMNANEWARIEWKIDSTAQTQEVRVFFGADVNSAIPTDQSGAVTFDTGTWDDSFIGVMQNTTGRVIIDAVADDDADWVGPVEEDTPPPTGDLVFEENFEGGTDGADLTTANTVFSSLAGTATPTFSATQPLEGTLCADFSTTTAATKVAVLDTLTPVLYFRRFYVRLTGLPSENLFIGSLLSSTAQRADMRIDPAGRLSVRDGWLAKWQAPQGFVVGDWNRVEWMVDVTNTIQQVKVFAGGNMHGDTPTADSGAVDYTGGTWDTIRLGTTTSVPNASVQFDAVADSDTDWVGPLAGTSPPVDATHFLSTDAGWTPALRELIV